MNTLDRIKQHQAEWAASTRIPVDDSGYTLNLNDNLFRPLSDPSEREFLAGRGDELGKPGSKAKMRALHSSAALVVNVFEYWRNRDASAIAKACGAAIAGSVEMHYEATHANALGGPPSHLDVQFSGACDSKPLAVEAKFTETYARHTRRTLASDYASRPGLWRGLPGCEKLAHRLREEQTKRTTFEHLDAPQLLKHILGLYTAYRTGFTLLYLWYSVDSAEVQSHRREIREFEDSVKDEVDFRSMTYQDLFRNIREISNAGADYLDYLRKRYFSEEFLLPGNGSLTIH